MHRRDFLTAATTLAASAAFAPALSRAEDSPAASPRQWIEIRNYHFSSKEKMTAYADFLAKAALPAYKRAGVASPIGFFKLDKADNPKLTAPADPNDLWLILFHDSAESFATLETKLAADGEFQDAGKEILTAPKDAPAFDRYDSMLLLSFEGHPRATAPADLSPDRVLELRTYMSRSEERHQNKVSMFISGEIPIFAECGMSPVFFGDARVGPDLPQLTYMICHQSLDEAKQDWSRFGKNPTWVKMKSEDQYKDNVSKTIARFLRPLPGSEI